jgi:hypothetical protein
MTCGVGQRADRRIRTCNSRTALVLGPLARMNAVRNAPDTVMLHGDWNVISELQKALSSTVSFLFRSAKPAT